MKRRVLSLLLVLALCVGMLPAPAWSEEPGEGIQAVQEEQNFPEAEPDPEEPAGEEAPSEPEEDPEDEDVKFVQALLDALPGPEEMSEDYIDALETAYDAYLSLTEAQQGEIAGADRLEALFAWVNGQTSMLAEEPGWTESDNTVTLINYNGSKQLSLTQDTVLVLNGTNRISREWPILLNGHTLTVQGSGSLEVVMQSEEIFGWNYGAISNGTTSDDHTGGTLVLESGTLTARGSCSGIAVGSVIVTGGSLYAYSEYGIGIAVQSLRVEGENTYVYASGSNRNGEYGISVADKATISAELSILYSGEKDAAETDMAFGTKDVFEDRDARTVLICKSDKPLISVGAQTGALYENAGGTATFTISGQNYTTVEANWVEPAPAGLTAAVSGDTLTVTGDKAVREGTYQLTLTATGPNGIATKIISVIVSEIPLTITKQPENNVTGQVEQTDFASTYIEVTPSTTDKVTYQWKVKGENEQGSDLTKGTAAKLSLADIPENMRQDTTESWKKTARVYCTVTYDGVYSVDSETVTVIFSTCDHAGYYSQTGKCQQCGYQITGNSEANTWIYMGRVYGGTRISNMLKSDGEKTIYLLHDIDRLEDEGTIPEGAIVDLQGHTVGSFFIGKFQNTTITNGTITSLNFPDSDKNVGSVTLAGITVTGTANIGEGTTVTVGENCVFKKQAHIEGETKLTGGTFEKGIAYSAGNAQHLLDILAEGYAYFKKDDQGNDRICEYFRADSENVSVKPHTCTFSSLGVCDCGRYCKHTHTDGNGVCTACGLMAQPFAIGEARYDTLKDAVNAATDGATVTMGSDALLEETITISKNITLDLGTHALVENCDETEQKGPISIAGTVTIRNGTIENRYPGKPTDAVGVIKNGRLTVEDANLNGSESDGIEGDGVMIVEGSMTLVSGTVRGIFVGTDGSLTVTGGTASWLGAGIDAGSIQLSGGTVAAFNGKTDCDSATAVKEMLAPYYAYANHMGELITLEAARNALPNWSVTIVKCTHPAGISETQACPYCGKKCSHPKYENGICVTCGFACNHPAEKVDENGLCVCGLRMAVKVEHGQTVSYYPQEINSEGSDATLYDIISSLQNNSTVTLLMDGIRLFASINNGNTVTLDLNGKKALESFNGIELFNNSTLKLIGTGSIAANGSSSNSFRMLSGTLDLSGWTGGNIGAVYIWSGTLKPPAQGGIAKLELNGTGTRLSGGWYGNVIRFSGASSEPAGNFLDGGHAFRNADGSFVNYDRKITQYKGIENVTVVLCPHEFAEFPTNLNERNCPYCNTILAALLETSTGTKGYAAAQYAVNDANQGDTVVLLNDLAYSAGTLTVSKPCTLDLNGYTVETLTVTGDVTLKSLLPQGYAYKMGSNWVSEPSGTTLTDVSMALVPFKDLRAENDSVTVTYGETATLKALVTAYGETPTMQWSKKENGAYTLLPGETGDTLSVSGLNAGSYVYRFTYNVEGYYESVDITVTVEKARVPVTTAPQAIANLVYTGKSQHLIIPGAAEKGTMYYTIGRLGSYVPEIPTALRAGTYQVYYYASPTDRDNYTYSEPQYIEVTIAPCPIEALTVQLGDTPAYDGGVKTQSVKALLGDVDVTNQVHVLGNTATKAGSYTMTLLSSGNFTGSRKVGWSVAPKSIAAQVTILDKDFDGTAEAAIESVTLPGIVDGDAVTVQAGKASFAHPAVGTWEVTLEPLTLTGADAGNYSLASAQPAGITATIRASSRYLDLSNLLPGETEVTIDGKKLTVSTDGGRFLNLPEEGDILCTYETGGDYPTGMQVYRILREKTGARLELIPELENLLQYGGCSIRLTGTKGIRMITALDKTAREALMGAGLAGFTLEEYGTVVAKKSGLGENDLTLETGSHNYAYKKWLTDPIFGTTKTEIQYTNVLVGFSLEDCREDLMMRPYIRLRDASGRVQTIYGGIVVRSIGFIAKQNENTYLPGTEGYRYIHEIIDAVYGKD